VTDVTGSQMEYGSPVRCECGHRRDAHSASGCHVFDELGECMCGSFLECATPTFAKNAAQEEMAGVSMGNSMVLKSDLGSYLLSTHCRNVLKVASPIDTGAKEPGVRRYFMRATAIQEVVGDAKCDCDTPCQCVVYATDYDKLAALLADLRQQLADHEEVHADKRRLVREIDVIMHGDGAAKQASLCDLVVPIQKLTAERDRLAGELATARELIERAYANSGGSYVESAAHEQLEYANSECEKWLNAHPIGAARDGGK
jgi:hypothetical protein